MAEFADRDLGAITIGTQGEAGDALVTEETRAGDARGGAGLGEPKVFGPQHDGAGGIEGCATELNRNTAKGTVGESDRLASVLHQDPGEEDGIAEEGCGLDIGGEGIDKSGRPGLDDDAIAHDGYMVGEGECFGLVVGDQDRSGAKGLEEGTNLFAKVDAEGRVDCGEGLVEEDDAWIGGECAGEGNALLLPP